MEESHSEKLIKVEKTKLTWERTKHKNGSEISYKSQLLKHNDHISISKTMYVDDEYKHTDLTHIPLEVIDKIKDLTPS